MAQAQLKRRMSEILKLLKLEYPEAKCSLNYSNPFQLLVATILSAQCTDERVNLVTPKLFQQYPTAALMAKASVKEIENLIRSVNFYKNKSISISQTARQIMESYEGEVPADLEELIKLRGVGRKTANVVLGVGFKVPKLVVDTHVGRVSRRMGFTSSEDPYQVEQELGQLVPQEDWILYAHLLIEHGRKICTARKAKCDVCVITHLCPKVGVASMRSNS